MRYPEHEKLRAVHEQAQVCGDFLTWLAEAKRFDLCEYREDRWGYTPARPAIPELLAEFFEIDAQALEAEKREMLDAVRERAAMRFGGVEIREVPEGTKITDPTTGKVWTVGEDTMIVVGSISYMTPTQVQVLRVKTRKDAAA